MNQYEVYDFHELSSNNLIYEFVSFGPQGLIKKIVEFEETADRNVYNLAFGNLREDGTLDDLTINNNDDRNKVLATVAFIVIKFMERCPDCYILISGSTKARIRLYRIAISLNYQTLSKTFNIWGLHEEEGWELFNSTRPYCCFLIKHK
jgi:hypothetical protein